ncbi:MAG TPA: FtsX-like permease family protein, partial [Chloroflexi bacterium]|nr:FtsX-like permease family protein [Chloroflexota bacterium]
MIVLKYILKSFGRHKARTLIMVLALLVVTVMLVLLNNSIESFQNQIVELVERDTGEHDITITRSEFSPSQWIDVERTSVILKQADPSIETIYPRFHATVEIQGGNDIGNASLLARTLEDDLGQVKVVDGEYRLDEEHVVILKMTADTFGLAIGDQVDLSYILPRARPKGYEASENASVGRVTRRFTISGIALATGLGGANHNGILANTETVQEWLNLPGRAERLVVVLDESVYKSLNTQAAIFRARRIAEKIYDALGSEVETYTFAINKAKGLESSDVVFAVLRSLGAVYGLMVMGVVGLLVYSIFNTNVEERQRDLAFLRILGAKRRHLFGLVIVEVLVIGLIGVGLGILIGQTLSGTVVSPVASTLISQAASGQEIGIQFKMSVTSAAM